MRNRSQYHLKLQVNLCLKILFLHQLTHNMTTDCSLNLKFRTRKIQVQNMLCTKIVLNAKTKSNFCTQHALNLYFSRTEVVNQWTICILLSYCGLTDSRMSVSKNKKFVDKVQHCFTFTPCVQFKPRFKCWQHLPDLDKIPTRPF